MIRQRIVGFGLSVALLAALVAFTGTAQAGDWPTRWQVNGNGVTGSLEFTVRPDGSLIGRLMDEYVEGYVSGRHLFIRRADGGRVEVWEGWLGEADPNKAHDLIVAGTISVGEDGRTMVYPWFGTPDAGPSSPDSSSSASTPAPVIAPIPTPAVTTPAKPPTASETPPTVPIQTSEETTPEATPSPESSLTTTPVAPPPAPAPAAREVATTAAPSDGSLSGAWDSTTGVRAEIVQDGKTLRVTLPDGTTRSGRMTGSSTLVVGLRKGCCNGEIESPGVIVWSDGARWQRVD